MYVYYTLVSIQEDLHCASQKALKLLKELESYGLIERVKQGLCKPDRIYVKNFILLQESPVRSGENHHTGVVKITSPECRESPPNNTEINNIECSNTNLILSKSREDERELYRQYLYQSLDIEILKERYPYGVEEIDEIFDIILDVLCSNQKFITISGDKKPINVVKSRFMKLDSSHIQFVMDSMKDKTTKVRNVKKYIVAALYNAPITINNYYQSLVQHDMATGKI